MLEDYSSITPKEINELQLYIIPLPFSGVGQETFHLAVLPWVLHVMELHKNQQ